MLYMPKIFLYSVVLILFIIFITGCVSKEINFTLNDNGRQIELTKGQSFTISLESQISTGYSWEVFYQDLGIVQQIGDAKVEQINNVVGGTEIQTFKFKTISRGNTTLNLVYHRLWEKDIPPLKNYSIHLVVR